MPEGCGLAVLRGHPAEPNADVFFRLPAGTTAPRHWHASAERMVLITGELDIGYDDQDPVVMELGTYAYGPSELPHDASCVSDDDCILFIAFEEPVDAIPVANPLLETDEARADRRPAPQGGPMRMPVVIKRSCARSPRTG